MRVLHVIASMSPKHGGPTDAIAGIYPYLRELGVETLVASTSDDLDDRLGVSHEQETDFLGARAIFFPNTFRSPRRLRDFAVSPSLIRWIRENIRRFDLLHVHALFSLVTWRSMSIAQSAGVPFVARPLGVLGRWSMAWHKKAFLNLCERSLLNQAAVIEYNSEQERAEAADLGITAPSAVIPLGFEPVCEMPGAKKSFCRAHGLDDSKLLVLFLSRIDPKKGLPILIQACAALPRDSFHLVIAGAGHPDYEKEMRQLARDEGVESSTLWTGFLAGEAKAEALRAADVFALPSHSESFGIAVAEAMSAECAIITTPHVPLAEHVARHHAGWVVDARPDTFSEALKTALNSPQDVIQMGKNASRHACEALSYKAVAPKLLELYRNASVHFVTCK